MNETRTLTELARRLLSKEVGEIQEAEALASAVVTVLAIFLTNVSSLMGVTGSAGLFRRSVRLTQAAFPLYTEALHDERNEILNAVGACLRTQTPDMARQASVALVTAYFHLLASFIGERLTRQLVLEAWPKLLAPPSEEETQA